MGSCMHRYAALGSFIQGSQGIAVASVQNRGGVFVSPYNCPFPFHQDELPPSISSPTWSALDFNATGEVRLHPERSHPERMQSGCLEAWHSSHLAGLFVECMSCIPRAFESVAMIPMAHRGDVYCLITLMWRKQGILQGFRGDKSVTATC